MERVRTIPAFCTHTHNSTCLVWNINRTRHLTSVKLYESAKITTVHDPRPQQIAGGHLLSGQLWMITKTCFVWIRYHIYTYSHLPTQRILQKPPMCETDRTYKKTCVNEHPKRPSTLVVVEHIQTFHTDNVFLFWMWFATCLVTVFTQLPS